MGPFSAWNGAPMWGMGVHQAGRQELAGAIDLEVARSGTPVRIDRQLRRADLLQHRDPAVLDDHVGGSPWRGTGTVDDRSPAQHQSLERTAPAGPGGRGLDLRQ